MSVLVGCLLALVPQQSACELEMVEPPQWGLTASYGYSLAVQRERLLIGAPRFSDSVAPRYAELRETGTDGAVSSTMLRPSFGLAEANFGAVVALGDDAAFVSGYEFYGGVGDTVHVFEPTPDGWQDSQRLLPSTPNTHERFGFSLAAEGHTLVVGAPSEFSILPGGVDCTAATEGAVYVFERGTTGWSETQRITGAPSACGEYFGATVALDGDRLAITNPSVGRVEIFERSAAGWNRVATLDGGLGPLFPVAGIALSGTTLVVGSPVGCILPGADRGFVDIFERDGSGAWNLVTTLEPGVAGTCAFFGGYLALEGDTLVVEDGSVDPAGAITMYRREAGAWSQAAVFTNPFPGAYSAFGAILALGSDQLITSAFNYFGSAPQEPGGLVVRYALPGVSKTYGASSIPSLGLELSGCPAPEFEQSVEVVGGEPFAPGVLLVGEARANVPLASVTSLVGPPVLTRAFHTLDALGSASIPFVLDVSFAGRTFTAQSIYISPAGLEATNGIELALF